MATRLRARMVDRAIHEGQSGDYESAIIVLRPLAEAGNREAQYELGFFALTECDLISGRGAFSLFVKAAEQGHAEVMDHLAQFPEFVTEPIKSPLSEEEAWRWLLRAAESGCVQAQDNGAASLATCDWGERGVPQDLQAAVANIGVRRRRDMPRRSSTSRRCSLTGKDASEICQLRKSG